MLSTPSQLCSNNDHDDQSTTTVELSNVFNHANPDILRIIVSYVGRRHYGFVGILNRAVRDIYCDVHRDGKNWYSFDPKSTTYERLCTIGHLKEFINDMPKHSIYRVFTIAVKCGNVPVLQYIHINYRAVLTEYSLNHAELCRSAAVDGNLPALQWLHENSIYYIDDCYELWHTYVCSAAASNGHLHIIQYARQHKASWDASTCHNASLRGHLHVLQWGRRNGCDWNKLVCQFAAYGGHLEILQWARENDCPWDAETCNNAAAAGRLDILQWARENGCPYDERSCSDAARRGGSCIS